MLRKKKSKLSKLSKQVDKTEPSKPITNMKSARAFHNLPVGSDIAMIFQTDELGREIDISKPLAVFVNENDKAKSVHETLTDYRPTILVITEKGASLQNGVYETEVLLVPVSRHLIL